MATLRSMSCGQVTRDSDKGASSVRTRLVPRNAHRTADRPKGRHSSRDADLIVLYPRGRSAPAASRGADGRSIPKAGGTESPIGMAEVLAWGYAIPDCLLQFLDLRKPSFLGSGPDRFIADTNLENTSSAR